MTQDANRLQAALGKIRERIARACEAADRDPGGVTVCAVTKGVGSAQVQAALDCGLLDIGENYVQDASRKFAAVSWPPGAKRHFIGRVQRNKAGKIAKLFDCVQTVTDLQSAQLLDQDARAAQKTLEVLVQINTAGDQRQGLAPDDLLELLSGLRSFANLRLRGLMTIGPLEKDARAGAFARAHECMQRVLERYDEARVLSMGMSDDLELAIANGSTMLRLGTALFGARPQRERR